MSLENFNLYMFRGLHGEFKDLVTSLITKAEPLFTYTTTFLLMNFYTRTLFIPWTQIPLYCLHLCYHNHHCCQHHSPLLILLHLITATVLVVPGGVLLATSIQTTTATTTRTGPRLLQTRGQTIGSRIGATQGLDNRMSGAKCA